MPLGTRSKPRQIVYLTLASAGLTQPTGVAVNSNGTIFVANNGESATNGEVVRIN